jgi:hypothetical protein
MAMANFCLRVTNLDVSNNHHHHHQYTAVTKSFSHPLEGVILTYTYSEASFLLPGGPNAQKKLLKQQEQMTRDLQKEIENLKLEANKHRKMIESLERERDRWGYIFLIIYNVIFSFQK